MVAVANPKLKNDSRITRASRAFVSIVGLGELWEAIMVFSDYD